MQLDGSAVLWLCGARGPEHGGWKARPSRLTLAGHVASVIVPCSLCTKLNKGIALQSESWTGIKFALVYLTMPFSCIAAF
jgi:hypothetical protein